MEARSSIRATSSGPTGSVSSPVSAVETPRRSERPSRSPTRAASEILAPAVAEHLISRAMPTHRRWDVDVEPVLHIEQGDVVVVETDDFAGGQIGRDSTAEDLRALDFDTIYPLAGPIHVAGAGPG